MEESAKEVRSRGGLKWICTALLGSAALAGILHQFTGTLKLASCFMPSDSVVSRMMEAAPMEATPIIPKGRLTLSQITTFSDGVCPKGLVSVDNTVVQGDERSIPRVIHMTASSRCLTPELAKQVEKWRLANYSLYVHDKDAVDRFLAQDFPLYPYIHNVLTCSQDSSKMDLWKYLLLWEHGGIYADLYTSPSDEFLKAIQPTDDAVYAPSGSLLGASPHHPLMYLAIHGASQAIWRNENLPASVATTGVATLRQAFQMFLKEGGINVDKFELKDGTFKGMLDRSVTVVEAASNTTTSVYVIQDSALEREETKAAHFDHQHSARYSCVKKIFQSVGPVNATELATTSMR